MPSEIFRSAFFVLQKTKSFPFSVFRFPFILLSLSDYWQIANKLQKHTQYEHFI